jgi:hypothetical protein
LQRFVIHLVNTQVANPRIEQLDMEGNEVRGVYLPDAVLQVPGCSFSESDARTRSALPFLLDALDPAGKPCFGRILADCAKAGVDGFATDLLIDDFVAIGISCDAARSRSTHAISPFSELGRPSRNRVSTRSAASSISARI